MLSAAALLVVIREAAERLDLLDLLASRGNANDGEPAFQRKSPDAITIKHRDVVDQPRFINGKAQFHVF
jgi:hypothetical protein